MVAQDTDTSPVIVIGGGIVGICTALSLAERGAKVRLIDRDEPGQGASYGNAGVISPWSVVPNSVPGLWKKIPGWLLNSEGPIHLPIRKLPAFVPWGLKFLSQGRASRVRKISDAMATLNLHNIELYRRHLKGTGYEGLIRDSMYVHAYRHAENASLAGFENDLRRAVGAEIELVDGAELRRIEPALSPDYQAALLIKGQARARNPGRIGQVLTDKLRTMGGDVLRRTVKSLNRHENGWQIFTDNGVLEADKIVIAAGAWSAALLKPLGIALPLAAERGYHIVFQNPGIELENSVMDTDFRFVSSSMEGGLRSAGTAEFTGIDEPETHARAQMLIRQSQRMLPDLNITDNQSWMGVRPSFPDSLPTLGPIPGFDGLFAAFGHSHYGLMMAPKTGELVADCVMGRRSNIDLGPYRPDRF